MPRLDEPHRQETEMLLIYNSTSRTINATTRINFKTDSYNSSNLRLPKLVA